MDPFTPVTLTPQTEIIKTNTLAQSAQGTMMFQHHAMNYGFKLMRSCRQQKKKHIEYILCLGKSSRIAVDKMSARHFCSLVHLIIKQSIQQEFHLSRLL